MHLSNIALSVKTIDVEGIKMKIEERARKHYLPATVNIAKGMGLFGSRELDSIECVVKALGSTPDNEDIPIDANKIYLHRALREKYIDVKDGNPYLRNNKNAMGIVNEKYIEWNSDEKNFATKTRVHPNGSINMLVSLQQEYWHFYQNKNRKDVFVTLADLLSAGGEIYDDKHAMMSNACFVKMPFNSPLPVKFALKKSSG